MTAAALPVCVAALYRFTALTGLPALRDELIAAAAQADLRGTLLLAPEGINGTIAGSDAGVAGLIDRLRALPGCADLDVKYARAARVPFGRLKVRIKREIVTMGEPGLDPAQRAGRYCPPQEWNALLADPDVVVIDTRNAYEVAIGTFPAAVNPQTRRFRDFPAWFRANRAALLGSRPNPKVAMFCTGGIRCEKSTAFLRSEGIEEVYHLQGGILAYLETVPETDSLWQGQCFVFDERVSVGPGLKPGPFTSCPACGWAVAAGAPCAACADAG